MIWILLAYLTVILLVARRHAGSNDAFFRGSRRSSWLMVAYGMVGASVSGVSFVSVPGMVEAQDMTYMQTCLGFIPGYILVAFVLLPIYYRLNLTSIYTLLRERLGAGAYRVGSWFFILSDMLGSAVKFYLVCIVLQRFVFDGLGVPFLATVPLLIACIWLYTRRGGVRTLVLTDVLQTTCMTVALVLIICAVATLVPFSETLSQSNHTLVFDFSDWHSPRYFWRQFVSGAFIVVVMTGLNQNMMQKNLTCRTLRDAQKDMCLSGLLFVPVNALFLILGALLLTLGLDAHGDALLPEFIEQVANSAPTADNPQLSILNSQLSILNCQLSIVNYQLILESAFVLGIVSAAFSTADSSLTALTTSYCVDIAGRPDDERLRRRVHVAMAAVLVLAVYVLRWSGSRSLIDLVYTLVSYTYGPLLGLFALALVGKGRLRTSTFVVAAACILSPILCLCLSHYVAMGYELLLVNAALTCILLWLFGAIRHKKR